MLSPVRAGLLCVLISAAGQGASAQPPELLSISLSPTTADAPSTGEILLTITVDAATDMSYGYVSFSGPGGQSASMYCGSDKWDGNTCLASGAVNECTSNCDPWPTFRMAGSYRATNAYLTDANNMYTSYSFSYDNGDWGSCNPCNTFSDSDGTNGEHAFTVPEVVITGPPPDLDPPVLLSSP